MYYVDKSGSSTWWLFTLVILVTKLFTSKYSGEFTSQKCISSYATRLTLGQVRLLAVYSPGRVWACPDPVYFMVLECMIM